jgi:DNA-directed RNA polymerase specialized sigma24 family protein
MEGLPERQQIVLSGIAEGRSYSEIGETIGISKQAVHKIASAAVELVKTRLQEQGFGGLDSLGLLASIKPTES